MDYNKLIKFAEENGYELHQYHKDIIEAICNGKQIILPRQNGRCYIMSIVKEYIKRGMFK